MKKGILSFALIAAAFSSSFAQAPDMGFETWVNDAYGTLQDPTGWASFNIASAAGMAQTVWPETAAPAVGLKSIRIVTDKVPNPPVAVPNPFWHGHNFDTVGFAGVGTITILPSPKITFGYTNTHSRAKYLSFESKSAPLTGDSSFVLAYLTKWDTTNVKRDTIAVGKYGTNATESAWTAHTITMSYNASYSTSIPDTFMIFASSSIYNHVGAKKGSVLYLDNFAWSGYVGIDELKANAASVTVFPNPATNTVNLKCSARAKTITVTDLAGRLVGSYEMQNNGLNLNTEKFISGVYFYSVMNDKNEIISRGKFEVAK